MLSVTSKFISTLVVQVLQYLAHTALNQKCVNSPELEGLLEHKDNIYASLYFLQHSTYNKIITVQHVCAKSLQSYMTFYNSMDDNPPGSSIHGILQARNLEWVAISFLGHLLNPGIGPISLPSLAFTGSSLLLAPPGNPGSICT